MNVTTLNLDWRKQILIYLKLSVTFYVARRIEADNIFVRFVAIQFWGIRKHSDEWKMNEENKTKLD